MFHIISLGAGVQSSTMALMATHGEIEPMPTAAIFADTQCEPDRVYRWLDWLEPRLAFPVIRATKGNLAEEAVRIRTSRKKGINYCTHDPPAFAMGSNGPFPLQRRCTTQFKIKVVEHELRRWKHTRQGQPVTNWIGISLDEAHRMKSPWLAWTVNRYPLIDLRMTRQDCLQWMADHGYPQPPRSACVFCPFQSNADWQRLKVEEPHSFQYAVDFEQRLMASRNAIGFEGEVRLHASMRPLDQVDFTVQRYQVDLFGNECEGMCGV